jgi:2,3-bisphosphoglycerate-dependent phosphoglycerate mutase
MANLIIVRHGQSEWNLQNRFTGETDVELSPLGREEAHHAGKLLSSFSIDECFTSVLKRAIDTLEIILEEIGKPNLPITKDKALNERNYGDLQGLNKAETETKYGAEQVLKWRRSFETKPPNGESLKDTYNRTIPYFQKAIAPRLKAGKSVLISAHGNSLRALMMYLENISSIDIENLNLATGVPRVYKMDEKLNILKVYYL